VSGVCSNDGSSAGVGLWGRIGLKILMEAMMEFPFDCSKVHMALCDGCQEMVEYLE